MKNIILCIIFVMFSSVVNAGSVSVLGDINGDGKVGLEEAVYSLQCVSGINPPSNVYVELDLSSYYNKDYSQSGFYDYFETDHVFFTDLPGMPFHVKSKNHAGPHVLSTEKKESYSVPINRHKVKNVYILGSGLCLGTDFGHKNLYCDDINHFSFTLAYSDGSAEEKFPANVKTSFQQWSDILHGVIDSCVSAGYFNSPSTDYTKYYYLYKVPVNSSKSLATVTINDKVDGVVSVDTIGGYIIMAITLEQTE